MTRRTARLGAFLVCVGGLLATAWALACDPETHPTRWSVAPVLAAVGLAGGLRWWALRLATDAVVRCPRCSPHPAVPGSYLRVGKVWVEDCPEHGADPRP